MLHFARARDGDNVVVNSQPSMSWISSHLVYLGFLTVYAHLCTAYDEMGIAVCLFEYVLSKMHQEGARTRPS
jgi:hypothetical protein